MLAAPDLMPPQMSSTSLYQVLLNEDAQFLVWPATRSCPVGWRKTGKTGTQAECLAYVDQVWTMHQPPGQFGTDGEAP
jgi:MbtH protein